MLEETRGIRLTCDGCGKVYHNIHDYASINGDIEGSLILGDAMGDDWVRLGHRHFCWELSLAVQGYLRRKEKKK